MRRTDQAALAAEILAAYARARWLLRRRDLRCAVAAVAERGAGDRPPLAVADPVADGRRLGSAVVRTLSVLPTDSRCLMRSLVLTRLLARRGVESTFVLGVKSHAGFEAHAWVEYDGRALLEPGGPHFRRLLEL